MKCGCSIYSFLSSANLTYRGTDLSKYFRESLERRDNDRRLYLVELRRSDEKTHDKPSRFIILNDIPVRKNGFVQIQRSKSSGQKLRHETVLIE